jgi:glycosyltransferase involved in cell wall biosynthesis
MRILFVSGTVTGGAARSTHELAVRLHRRGHEIAVLARRKPARRIDPDRGKTSWLPMQLRRGTSAVMRQATRRPALVESGHYLVWETRFVERAAPFVFDDFAPDVVVVNSVYRRAWNAIHRMCQPRVPLVLYQREHGIVEQLRAWDARPDLVITNAETHSREAARWGFEPVMVPSIVDVTGCRVDSSRERILFVNPVASRGLGTALGIAARRPDLPFVFQESWPLVRRDRQELARMAGELGNVELRPFTSDAASVYRDARILLAPYVSDNRPRVVLEAQLNGIPVLASDCDGLREAVGAGGVLISRSAPIEEWVASLTALWEDDVAYAECAHKALEHAARPEVDADRLTGRFEQVIQNLLSAVVTPRDQAPVARARLFL